MRRYEDHLELALPSSKTEPFRPGVTLTMAGTNDEACTVRALEHLFQRWPAPLSSPRFEIHGVFTRHLVTKDLRQASRFIDLQNQYFDHSFRRGATTSARIAGLTENEIMLLGRWKSDSYRLYIKTHPASQTATCGKASCKHWDKVFDFKEKPHEHLRNRNCQQSSPS